MLARLPIVLPLWSVLVAAAQPTTSVVSLMLPQFDQQTILASVVRADPTATVYDLACPEGEDSSDCGLAGGIRVTEGPSTLAFRLVDEPTFTASVNCAISKAAATCTQTVGSGKPETTIFTDTSSFIVPVTVTAGLQRLSPTDTGASSTALPGITRISSSALPGITRISSSNPPGITRISTSTSGDAAGAAVTQNAVLVGVAAVVAGGAMAL